MAVEIVGPDDEGMYWKKIATKDAPIDAQLIFLDELAGDLNHWRDYVWTVTALEQHGDTNRLAIRDRAGRNSDIDKNHPHTWMRFNPSTKEMGMSKVATLWKLLEKVITSADRMLLYGPPGTGKTRLACMAARTKKQEVYNVYLTEETPSAELRGHYVPKGDEWVWQDGPAILAWKNGGRLVLNEINNASGDALDFLLAITDDAELAGITLPTGETVYPIEGFQCIATMNGEPDDLPPALQDRFVLRARLTEPHPDAIKRLPEDIQGALSQKAHGAAAGTARYTSVRSWLAFDRLRVAGISETDAAQLVFEDNGKQVCEALTLRRDGKPYRRPTRAAVAARSRRVAVLKRS